ncbi:hypothetical protein TNCV_4347171 [Trichonephila clavipes]|nr:hypothetical protein TNCV_4347171 [Trichonephila clavipes]
MHLLCRRREYEHLSEFEKGRIIKMREAIWSAQRVAREVSRSDLTVRRFWDLWTEETTFTRLAQSAIDRPVIEKTVTSYDVHA